MSFPVHIEGSFGQEKEVSASASPFGVPLGSRMALPDGRKFVLCKASTAAAIGAGHVVQEPATLSASADMDVELLAAAAVGATSLTVRLASTVAKDAYEGGYVYINDGDGEGHIYRIKNNTAITASGAAVATTVTLEDGDALTESCAISASVTETLVGLVPSPYNNVIVRPTTVSGRAVGVTPREVTAGYYFWAQTWGEAACLVAATVCVAYSAVISDTAGTAGAVAVRETDSAAASPNEQILGYAGVIPAVDTDYQLVYLTIAP